MSTFPNKSTQEQWLADLKAGDEKAFSQLYRHYWPSLYAVTYNHVRERETAEELVQELFTKLWLKRSQLTIHTCLQAYLVKAIRHQIYDHLDKQAVRQRVHQQLVHQDSEAIYTTEETIAFEDLQARLIDAVDQLPQPAQTIFRMSRFDYLSTQDIALKLNLSSKMIEYHLTRALRLLRLQLKDFVLMFLMAAGIL